MSSEMSEYWRDVKAAGQENRERNRESSPAVLTRRGITYETKNDGTHLIVKHAGKTVDFWPGTGLWRARKGPNGRGVFRLLSFLDNIGDVPRPRAGAHESETNL